MYIYIRKKYDTYIHIYVYIYIYIYTGSNISEKKEVRHRDFYIWSFFLGIISQNRVQIIFSEVIQKI